eukprot:CAMPEP_0116836140 /NCGR_PEP_ID=MMETSP0418-20121206/7928_1 /TAXON_ID=1158023 /ORGANISM="Astrosyne radiata, Strain 13vi08-1A" /LENGTH=337 /DNA_ID=CAMNT_0004465871 /DNA_START=147 /DNA_END=1160 /DNA_ORIENTATION=-
MKKHSEHGFHFVQRYAESLDSTKKNLLPLVRNAGRSSNHTVVVMVSNFGQSDLLKNFVCRARSLGISLKHVLVFCTDKPTKRIAKSLGLHAYHDVFLFQNISTKYAETYGDKAFSEMMLVKVVAVQWVNSLGFNVLFQDLDVVWYEDPLEFFRSFHHDWDMVFQEDGARSVRYAPFSANSGVYYVKSTPKTRHFMTQLVHNSDLVLSTRSHQQALTALLVEHTSMYGLKVKTLTRDLLPGGFHFHRDFDYMKRLFARQESPVLFHMSWTENKENKVKFFQQTALWYVLSDCLNNTAKVSTKSCCSKEPLVMCHYRDKPSAKPCPDSPQQVKNAKSFW